MGRSGNSSKLSTSIPDSELISASRPADFAVVFDRHFDAVYHYLQRRIGRDLAEELSAETFLVAFDLRERYDASRADSLPWLLGIATNLLHRHRRREVRELRAYARSAKDPLLEPFEGLEERVDASGTRRRLVEALAELPESGRDALLLAAWGELSYVEIAEALDVPLGTVRSRLSRARRQIGAALRGEPALQKGDHEEVEGDG